MSTAKGRRAVGVTATLLVLATVANVVAIAAQAHDHGITHAPARYAFEREMDSSMARMMEAMHASGHSGDADVDFLAMMIPHHAGAIDMARLVLQHGRDPVTRQLAEEITAAQQAEIESMQRRLALLRQATMAPLEEFPSLGGTRGP
jgi:hypothetical protein